VIGGFMKLSCGDIANDDNEIYEYKILHITFAVKNEFPFWLLDWFGNSLFQCYHIIGRKYRGCISLWQTIYVGVVVT